MGKLNLVHFILIYCYVFLTLSHEVLDTSEMKTPSRALSALRLIVIINIIIVKQIVICIIITIIIVIVVLCMCIAAERWEDSLAAHVLSTRVS